MKPDFMIQDWRSLAGKDSKPLTEKEKEQIKKKAEERWIEKIKKQKKWEEDNGVRAINIDDGFLENLYCGTSIWVKKEDFEKTKEAIRVLKECIKKTENIEGLEEYEYA